MRLKISCSLLILVMISACTSEKQERNDEETLNRIGTNYVKLGLTIGQYDPDFVDAYYGPDSLKPQPLSNTAYFPTDTLLSQVSNLRQELA